MLIRFFCLCFFTLASFASFAKTPVVLISIDGFAFHYLQQNKPETLLKLAKQGSYGPMIPVYPSKTFPNHLSLITGLYPVQHGIIHNEFYRTDIGKDYHLGAGAKEPRWLFGKPLWVVAQEQGLKTAVYFWPESEAEFAGQKPDHYFPYNKKTTNQTRIDQIIDWLTWPAASRPDFIASYFSIVDTAGHEYGPNSPQLNQAVQTIDALINDLIKRLPYPVNLILVSDHGMVNVDQKHPILWQQFIKNKQDFHIVDGQTQLLIYGNNQAKNKALLEQLSAQEYQPYFTAYAKQNFPNNWHLNQALNPNNIGIPDIMLDANPPYVFSEKLNVSPGTHGYDPAKSTQLNAFFIALGPDIKQQDQLSSFSNLAVFPLITKLLQLKNPTDIANDQFLIEHVLKYEQLK